MIDDQVKHIQKQYGKLVNINAVENNSEVTGTFVNDDQDINNKATFSLEKLKENLIVNC